MAISCCGVPPGDCHGPYGPGKDTKGPPVVTETENLQFRIDFPGFMLYDNIARYGIPIESGITLMKEVHKYGKA